MRLKDIDQEPFEDWIDSREHVKSKYKRKKDYRLGAQFYFSKEWAYLRAEVLVHYGRKCMKCGCTNRIMQVDHIIPRYYRKDLELDFNNLQVLCRPCNLEKGIKTIDFRSNKK